MEHECVPIAKAPCVIMRGKYSDPHGNCCGPGLQEERLAYPDIPSGQHLTSRLV